MKITVIGGGSTYTPELIEGFVHKESSLTISEIFLHDIDPYRLEILGSFAQRMASHAGARFKIIPTLDLQQAIEGADFVLSQIRVGGQEARHRDIQLCLKYGLIGQETTGIGGFAKALRTLPKVSELCNAMEQYAPKAWMLNFTNPSGLITEMIVKHSSIRVLGLCNIPMEVKILLARELSVEHARIRLEYIGLNHLAWLRRVLLDDQDITTQILEQIISKGAPKNIPDFDYDPVLVSSLGMIPMYYLRYYYYKDRMFSLIKSQPKDRAEEVMDIEKKLLAIYRDPSMTTKPDLLNQRGGAYYSVIAVELIEALTGEKKVEHIVNLPNNGATPDLPPDAVIEAPALVNKSGAYSLPIGRIDCRIRGLIQLIKAYEELTIRAGLNNDYHAAFLAMITHPLGPTAENAEPMLNELLAINGLHFFRT